MFNYDQATKLYLSSLRVDGMSEQTLATYTRILGYYRAFCDGGSLDYTLPASVALYKAKMAEKGNKLVTISMHLNIIKLFFDFAALMKLYQGTNPVLPELMPPQTLFLGNRPSGVHIANWLRNRAIVLTLLGCGLRNTELRMLTLNDLTFGQDDEANITVRSGKGDKFRIVPFPALTQQAVKAYLESGERPSGLSSDDILFGIGKTRDEWRMMTDENLSVLCKRYIKAATGFDNARSHACRHAFASFNLTHGVPMAEIQSMLGHSSITTTEHYASLLRPTAPTASGNKVFNDMFSNLCEA